MATKILPELLNYSHLQTLLDSKTSRKILQLARDQQEELELRDELEVTEKEADRFVENVFLASCSLTFCRIQSRSAYRDAPLLDSDEDDDMPQDARSDAEEYEELVSQETLTLQGYLTSTSK